MINFRAKFHSIEYIQNLTPQNQWVRKAASFVELTPDSDRDVSSLRETAYLWNAEFPERQVYYNTFATDMMRDIYFDKYTKMYRFFALTNQFQNFENLDSDKILGLVQIKEKSPKLNEIVYLQTEPQNMHGEARQKYKYIGSTIIDALRNLFPFRDIELNPIDSSYQFYKKYGFKDLPETRFLRYFA